MPQRAYLPMVPNPALSIYAAKRSSLMFALTTPTLVPTLGTLADEKGVVVVGTHAPLKLSISVN